jgi:site-specific DNA-methyltransferase (adenine-specific)
VTGTRIGEAGAYGSTVGNGMAVCTSRTEGAGGLVLILEPDTDYVIRGENLVVLQSVADESFGLIYIDPPFNTGKVQRRVTLKTVRDESGDRTGFSGRRYASTEQDCVAYDDVYDDYLAFLEPRIREARRLLSATGTLYLHLDYREVHYAKVLCDQIFGRLNFLNEIIWAYDYGARTKKRWPAKHDTILVYVMDPKRYIFNGDVVDREPYMAPGLVTPEKIARGKLPTDTWWHTIVSPTGMEKTGYPTQKPEGILRRIIAASSLPGDAVGDFFAGSGTTGAVARALGRRFAMVDSSSHAIRVMHSRLGDEGVQYIDWPSDRDETCEAEHSAG